jgi:hypothetical protein
VDLVTDLVMTGEPDEVAALIPFEIPGIDPVRYRAYPVADHVADNALAKATGEPLLFKGDDLSRTDVAVA